MKHNRGGTIFSTTDGCVNFNMRCPLKIVQSMLHINMHGSTILLTEYTKILLNFLIIIKKVPRGMSLPCNFLVVLDSRCLKQQNSIVVILAYALLQRCKLKN